LQVFSYTGWSLSASIRDFDNFLPTFAGKHQAIIFFENDRNSHLLLSSKGRLISNYFFNFMTLITIDTDYKTREKYSKHFDSCESLKPSEIF
jgi:hypothetical protein